MAMVTDERLVQAEENYRAYASGANAELKQNIESIADAIKELRLYREACRQAGATRTEMIREWVRVRMEAVPVGCPAMCSQCVSGPLGADKSFCRPNPCENYIPIDDEDEGE